jgi:hypothetical protein
MTVSTCGVDDPVTNFVNNIFVQEGCGGSCVDTEVPAFAYSCPGFPFGSSVTFDSEDGKSYRILVASDETSQAGIFDLSLWTYQRPPNDSCSKSIELTVNDPIPVAGTNNAALITKLDCTGSAGTTQDFRGVYYAFAGTGNVMTVSTCHPSTDFQTSLAVQEGCGSDECVVEMDPGFSTFCAQAFGSTFTFDSKSGESYRVFVHGDDTTSTGNFAISVQDYMPPPNDSCGSAIALVSGVSITGSTVGATLDDTCGMPNPGRGVWYVIAGTGEVMEVTTANAGTDFPTALNVIKGCGGDCVENNVDFLRSNPFGQTITFDSESNTNYYIFVHGASPSDVGTFEVSAKTFPRPPNDDCTNAISLKLGETLSGNTQYASPNTRCGGETRRGIWYAIAANTDQRLEVNTCLPGTDTQFDLQIQQNCKSTCTDTEQSQTFGCAANALSTTTRFNAFDDYTYYIYVSAPMSSVTGNVEITAAVAPPTSAPTFIQTCEEEFACENFLSFKGHYVRRNILGRCISYCAFFPGLKLLFPGWKCGRCP